MGFIELFDEEKSIEELSRNLLDESLPIYKWIRELFCPYVCIDYEFNEGKFSFSAETNKRRDKETYESERSIKIVYDGVLDFNKAYEESKVDILHECPERISTIECWKAIFPSTVNLYKGKSAFSGIHLKCEIFDLNYVYQGLVKVFDYDGTFNEEVMPTVNCEKVLMKQQFGLL